MRREGRPDSAHGLRGPLSPSLGTSGSLLNWREGLEILAGRKIYERSLLTAECLGHGRVHPQSQSLKAERLRVRDQPGLHETLSQNREGEAISESCSVVFAAILPFLASSGDCCACEDGEAGLGGGCSGHRGPGQAAPAQGVCFTAGSVSVSPHPRLNGSRPSVLSQGHLPTSPL